MAPGLTSLSGAQSLTFESPLCPHRQPLIPFIPHPSLPFIHTFVLLHYTLFFSRFLLDSLILDPIYKFVDPLYGQQSSHGSPRSRARSICWLSPRRILRGELLSHANNAYTINPSHHFQRLSWNKRVNKRVRERSDGDKRHRCSPALPEKAYPRYSTSAARAHRIYLTWQVEKKGATTVRTC